MTLRLRADPSMRAMAGGRVLLGGSPLRLVRLSEAGAGLVDRWRNGEAVGAEAAHRRLAARLVGAGMMHPEYDKARLRPSDVTVVIPVRDHAVRSPTEAREVIVVDDGSASPIPGAAHRNEVARGPAAARNTGWRKANTELVAFLDADARPESGWLDPLLRHFEDPAVAAVAPRVRSAEGTSVLARYERARSPLDLGGEPAQVRPGSRVSYLPTAALVVRTATLRELDGFDESLRFGEDVDLVWRIVRSGGLVRYEPGAEVVHAPRPGWSSWLRQRFDYGTSAAPLARRHGYKAIAPLRVSGWTALAWLAAATGRPVTGLAIAMGTAALLPRKLPGVPARESLSLALRGHFGAARFLAEALTRTWGPFAVPLLAIAGRKERRILAFALTRHLADWARERPAVDPLRWLAARTADDLGYGAGVCWGCVRERTVTPLIPDLSSWPVRRPPPPSTEAHSATVFSRRRASR